MLYVICTLHHVSITEVHFQSSFKNAKHVSILQNNNNLSIYLRERGERATFLINLFSVAVCTAVICSP